MDHDATWLRSYLSGRRSRPDPPPMAHDGGVARHEERERRPTPRPDDGEGGDPACWVRRVCAVCGRLADEDPPTRCPACGALLTAD
jgi:hypothetical protein